MYDSLRTLKKTVLVFMLLYVAGGLYANGLRFLQVPDNTSLDLFGESIKFRGWTTVEFDFLVYDHSKFGQICVLDIDGNPLSLTIVEPGDSESKFVLTKLNRREDFTEIPYPVQHREKDVWEKARFVISPQMHTVTLEIAGSTIVKSDIDISQSFRMNVLFGGSMKTVLESPDIAVRNIRVTGVHRSFFFPLNEVSGNTAHSEDSGAKGTVINPHWLTHDRHYWKKVSEFTADKAAGVAFDPLNDRVVIVDRDSLKIFKAGIDGDNGSLTVSAIEPHLPFYGYSGEAVYDCQSESVVFYNFMDKAGVSKPFVAGISLSGTTGYYSEPFSANPRHHHAYAWFPEDKGLYVFGGYGNLEYRGDILAYNFSSSEWEDVEYSGDRIPPRMHTVSGVLSDDEMLIFGGVGNRLGRQELGKEFYYDLYRFNTRTREMVKLWEITESENYVPTRNIVVNDEKTIIYVFCRDRGAKSFLKSYDLNTGKSEKVSDELFYPTEDIISSYYLFRSRCSDRLFLVNRHSDDEYSVISVFSLDYPPVSIIGDSPDEGKGNRNALIIMLISVMTLAGVTLAFLLIRKSGRQEIPAEEEESPSTWVPVPNSILFFGEFTVIDRNGYDITSRFGLKIRQLLSCLMLHTENYGGISTLRLTEALWPDRTIAESKNVRGVSMNHLRSLIEDVDGIEIVFEDNRWKVLMDDRLYWDYAAVKRLADRLSIDTPDRDAVANEFVGILSRGPLLDAFVSNAWFDNIKIDSEEHYYSVLEKLVSGYYRGGYLKMTIMCADIMFSIDRFSETALHYKVAALKKMGKPELARQLSHRFSETVNEIKM